MGRKRIDSFDQDQFDMESMRQMGQTMRRIMDALEKKTNDEFKTASLATLVKSYAVMSEQYNNASGRIAMVHLIRSREDGIEKVKALMDRIRSIEQRYKLKEITEGAIDAEIVEMKMEEGSPADEGVQEETP